MLLRIAILVPIAPIIARSKSEPLEGQVAIGLQEAVVPVQDPVVRWYLLRPLQDQLHHLIEVPAVNYIYQSIAAHAQIGG